MSERKRVLNTLTDISDVIDTLMAIVDDLEEDLYDIDCDEAADEAAEADAYDDMMDLEASGFGGDHEKEPTTYSSMEDFIKSLFEGVYDGRR